MKLDSFYDLAMAPLEKRLLAAYRELVLGRAAGRVLELGAGFRTTILARSPCGLIVAGEAVVE